MIALAVVVGAPAAGAVVAAGVPGRVRPVVGAMTSALTGVAAAALAWQGWREAAPRRVAVPAPAETEFVLVADGLAIAMVLMTAVVGCAASAFAVLERGDARGGHRAYWPLWLALWAGLHVLFLAGDLFTAYLMLELVGICGAALVMLGGKQRVIVAGARYFYAELVASITFLLGLALVWAEAGTLEFAALPGELIATPAGQWGVAAMTAGLLLKVPLVPLHFWLPGAHALAPGTVSPILSAVVVKSAFAVGVRLWFLAVPGALTMPTAQLLGALGAVAVLWGSLNALRAQQIKVLIAHSTLAQLGLLFLLPPLVQAGAAGGWSGGVLHAIVHALPKAAVLMVAAVLARAAGTERLDGLAGTAAHRPLGAFALGAAAVSLVGLPPSGGFVAKWYLLEASLATGQWWWAVVIVAGTLLTAGYLLRLVRPAFTAPPTGSPVRASRPASDVVALVLALAAVVLGLRPTELLELVAVGAPL